MVMGKANSRCIIRFGAFEIDSQSGELRKQGLRVKLRDQAFQILSVLLDRPGEVVSREELQKKLWPADTFVDFDRGLNKAINHLREALGDSAENPRFIETLPKRGYRFIAPAEEVGVDSTQTTPLLTEREAIAVGGFDNLGDARTAPRMAVPSLIAEPPLEIRESSSGTATMGAASARKAFVARARWWRRGVVLAVVFVLPAITLVGLRVYENVSTVEPQVVRFLVLPPEKTAFANPIAGTTTSTAAGAISPDGRNLAFTARDSSGKVLLWVRALDSIAPRPLPNTEGAGLPFWSPDSRWIGFFAQGKLKKIDPNGGAPQVLCDAPVGEGGTWNRDGTIVFAPWLFSLGLSKVSSLGGDASAITKVAREDYHRFPSFLPDGRHFLYFAQGGSSGVYVGSLDSEKSQRLLSADSAAIYAQGYLFFVREGTLFAQRFDVIKLQLIGDPIRIAESVPFDFNAPAFSISGNGILTYRTGSVGQNLQFAWFDRTGKLLEPVGPPGPYRDVNISPDGKRIAVHRHEGQGGDIWIFEPDGATTRLTFDATQDNSGPIWSPDGRRIVFGSLRNGLWGLYQKSSSGGGTEELLLESDRPKVPMAWSSDSIVFWILDPKTTWDLSLFSIVDHKAIPLLNSTFHESHAQISPDGKWLAYHSDRSGQYEIYVKPFPSGEGVWQVSSNWGGAPRWRGDGKEIFYYSAADNGKIMAVPVKAAGNTFEHGVPRELFDSGWFSLPHSTNYHVYDVSRDGQRFLVPRPVSSPSGENISTPITVIVNWTALLKQQSN